MIDVKVKNYYRVYYICDFQNNLYLHTDGIWRRTTSTTKGDMRGFFPDFNGALLMAELWGCRIVEMRKAPPEVEDDRDKEAREFITGIFKEIE